MQGLYADIEGLKPAGDTSRLRDSSDYQKIRSEINRRFNPLAGLTDWEKVRTLCEKVAQEEGVDLLVAIYYTVAAMKTRGLAGLANGLELQVSVLGTGHEDNDMPAARRLELYRWMLGRIGEEVRAMRPEQGQIRELYRCERSLQAIDAFLSKQNGTKVDDLDALGFTIFEHIDRLESRSASRTPAMPVEVEVKKQNVNALIFFVGLTVGAVAIYVLLQLQGTRPNPTTQLTTALPEPKIITLEEAQQIHKEFGTEALSSHREQLLTAYTDKVSVLTASTSGDNLLEGIELANSLAYVFPEAPEVTLMNKNLQDWQEGLLAEVEELKQRFVTARTRAANLSLSAKNGNFSQVEALATGLENYAISLSPLIGRLTFVEQQIAEGNLERAKQELALLDADLKAITLKKALLEREIEASDAEPES
ncbi:Type VI secretion-related protein VasL [Enterovibrio norvegicus]|uniref:type VI secretion system ImpA family N-terminal domain-containing protein n=1 Tax=Enterovibrio norvegicus TaxID=188144 RepID=UPI000C849B3D|nr:type VI secretion system ImpA family N-terminal domain-containing protein [Enterovibrio norvegicus]MCC4800604.1 type VI secretion system ImpA family N-terminal domain-containing protein [Enterovibrio norvegicus]PMI31756.1 Type VI secretion-related protein VasL [Enterovibrio norvegicus]PMI38609.1 Type VI secretion-related protein VasL [Enterovibrio norvegicus]PMN51876.1 Type VI secretion-related protein VasL [Enterovibrio norvegicus]TKF19982.1 Type VI secretion-related protein VasL [Enterovi